MRSAIQQQVLFQLAKTDYPLEPWHRPAHLTDDLHLGWASQTAFVEWLEQHFGIDILESERHTLRTLRDVCLCVESHLRGCESPFGRLLTLLAVR
ncbi:hypothetical protein [uncultured Hymenobacter sp.]|uniref:hypothetical protein n=1 Tax=uncultured Hymenobacter sp. TaxID=170016 RepID=UPI0035CBB221